LGEQPSGEVLRAHGRGPPGSARGNRRLESTLRRDRGGPRRASGRAVRILAAMRAFRARWFGRFGTDAELEEEIRVHIAHRADDLEGAGLDRAEAERRARVEFGHRERLKEECREALGGRFVESVLQDLRYGWRALEASPGFAAAAI